MVADGVDPEFAGTSKIRMHGAMDGILGTRAREHTLKRHTSMEDKL
jgi:hypothetical protein